MACSRLSRLQKQLRFLSVLDSEKLKISYLLFTSQREEKKNCSNFSLVEAPSPPTTSRDNKLGFEFDLCNLD